MRLLVLLKKKIVTMHGHINVNKTLETSTDAAINFSFPQTETVTKYTYKQRWLLSNQDDLARVKTAAQKCTC